jgi:hypothetical protein
LHAITAAWASDYALQSRNHTFDFEFFEVLLALAFLSVDASKEKLEAACADRSNPFIWSPVSRASWNSENRGHIFARLEEPEIQSALLKGGFGRGDEKHLKLSVQSLRALMTRVSLIG